MHRYPRDISGNSYQGLPFEAVLYSFTDGTPIAAWRNEGVFGQTPRCEVVPVLGQGRLWLLGFAEGTGEVGVASAPLGTSPTTLTPTAIDSSVLRGTKAASSTLLALESSDGRLYRVDTDGHVTDAFGPGVRLWIRTVVGDDVIAGSNGINPPMMTYYRLGSDGFQMLLPEAGPLATDGVRLYWVEQGTAGWELKTGRIGAEHALSVDEDATVLLAFPEMPVDLSASGDVAAVVIERGSIRIGVVIDLATKAALGEFTLPGGPFGARVVGVEGEHVWYGTEDIDGDGAFQAVHRAAYAPAQ